VAIFQPRVFPEIVGDMVTRLIATTPLTDINFGSVFTTMLEAAAQEDDEQYFQMLEIIRGYSLDTTTGTDLEDRAFEYGLVRLAAQTASTNITLGDSAITKIETGVYSGLTGAVAGSMAINGDSQTGFPVSGSIVIGRGTPNVETKPYSGIVNNGNYVTFTLTSALGFDHGTDESIILSQGGNRLVTAGTVVMVPASDISEQIDFSLDANATILDGESEVTDIPVTASIAGTSANVPVGAIMNFDSLPFASATVTNPARVTNGSDEETDQELRDRIKNTIQSLSRGTATAIKTGVVGVLSELENKRVVSASLIEPTIPADVVKLFIDDGTGFVPLFLHVGLEEIVASATGGEKFLQINNVPIVKAFVETQNEEPYSLTGTQTLFVEVGGVVETITFQSTDFAAPGAATAQEVLKKINSTGTLCEARISSAGAKVRIFSRTNFDEQIRVTGGTANAALSFPTDLKYTSKLYIERDNDVILLNKDGTTASIESVLAAGYDFSGFDHNLCIVVDGKVWNPQQAFFTPANFLNPVSGTAIEVVEVINEQISGLISEASSNDTKVSLTSNIERSSNSKVRIVEDFDKVFLSNPGFTDITANAKTNGSNSTLFAANGDLLYVGHQDVSFGSIFFNLATLASSAVSFTAEFWNGTIWQTIGVSDGTNGFTSHGLMLFQAPISWTPTIVNGFTAYWIRITRTSAVLATPPVESRIRVCSANEILGFLETEAVGTDRDYTLNRFIGQIELVSPLQSLDRVTLGSLLTRAAITSVTGSFGLVGGEVLNIQIDGVAQSATFLIGDFFTPGAALPAEVVARLNADLVGITASVVSAGTKVQIVSNKLNGGSLLVTGGTANSFLNFPTTIESALDTHIPAVESGTAGPYVFAGGSVVVIVMDGNGANNFTIPLFRSGTLGAGTTAALLFDASLQATFPLAEDLAGYDALITSGPELGNRRSISSYNPGTGQLTLASSFGGSPGVGETFEVIPVNAVQVVRLWNNKQITLISTEAEVSASSGGAKVQVASLESGENASVQVSGGTGNLVLTFPLSMVIGVDGYRHFTGLAQVTQWTIDGREDDQDNYPGVRAAGIQVEVAEPVKTPIEVELDVTTREGVTLSSIGNDVKSAVSAYINTLPVGGDVIISEIIVAVKAVQGVFDVRVVIPSANVAIADSELARIDESDVVVG
jgi:uncharacterized phage protein gp47/JayE